MADFCHAHCHYLRGHPLLPSRDGACQEPCYGDFTEEVNRLAPEHYMVGICEGCEEGGFFAIRNKSGEIKTCHYKLSFSNKVTVGEIYDKLGITQEWVNS